MNLVKIKKLNFEAVIPTRGTTASAGYDLYSTDESEIWPGETRLLHTGLAMVIPEGYFGAIYPRSGISVKKGLRLANCTAVIDSDYRGEIMIALHNDSGQVQFVKKGDRVAQMVFQPYANDILFEDVREGELSETDRGTGGFGSTGK